MTEVPMDEKVEQFLFWQRLTLEDYYIERPCWGLPFGKYRHPIVTPPNLRLEIPAMQVLARRMKERTPAGLFRDAKGKLRRERTLPLLRLRQ